MEINPEAFKDNHRGWGNVFEFEFIDNLGKWNTEHPRTTPRIMLLVRYRDYLKKRDRWNNRLIKREVMAYIDKAIMGCAA